MPLSVPRHERPPQERSVALSPLTGDLVHGPVRPARVITASRYAVFLDVAGRVLPVVTSDALALPTAARLSASSQDVAFTVQPADRAGVGGRRILLPGMVLTAGRLWRPARVCEFGSADGFTLEIAHLLQGALTSQDSPQYVTGARCLRSADPQAAVTEALGRGEGLTPSGDDAVAGAVLLAFGLGHPCLPALVGAVRSRLNATTAVSAALLAAATDGWAVPCVVRLVSAALIGDADAVRDALPDVLAIGHSSGRDLVAGLAGAHATLTSTLWSAA